VIPLLSLLTTVIAPVQATLVPRIVADERLSRSNSVLATVTLGLDVIFDALGGLFIAVFGTTALFLLDPLTFAIASVLFFGMVIPMVDGSDGGSEKPVLTGYVADLRAGVNVCSGTAFVDMMFISAVLSFTVGVTLAILPAFGDSLGGAAVYGLLLGALGIRVLPRRRGIRPVENGHLPVLRAPLARIGLLVVAGAHRRTVRSRVGLGRIDGVMIETLNQKVFPSDLLGRMSAIKGTASTATLPIGSLAGGFIL
jgi:hypothetical protein